MIGPHNAGDIINSRYLIKKFLGEGGMQFVYLSVDMTLNREVALKTPKNSSAEKRFHRSAVVAARVNHPNVAKTLDYVEVNSRAYLIEELVNGGDLFETILKRVDYVDPFLVARLFHYLSKGLAASHHAGVIHRDLKPTNIMVVGGFNLLEVKITDFGIAKMAAEELVEAAEGGSDSITASATAVGALPYMSPEAIETPRNVCVKTDVWSLGAMMYELLTGNRPFGAGLQAVRRILDADYADFPDFVTSNPQFSTLSHQLIDLIKKCLVIDPELRPTIDELVEACGLLCYPVSERYFGIMRIPEYKTYGFIFEFDKGDVFYHTSCIYGVYPMPQEQVMFSKHFAGGADRALPVVRMKQ